jgi:type I restriction enzyme S subunit
MNKFFTLADCCNFQEGYVNPTQKEPRYFGGKIKWLRASDLNDGFVFNTERHLTDEGFHSAGKSAKLFDKNTLAISKSGTIGSLGILKDRMCGNRAVINIKVNEELADLMYIFYTLKLKKSELISLAGGSIQKNLYVSALETLKLNHVELKDQRKISQVLSAIDAKIFCNTQTNIELESLAKSIFNYWFVQFDFPDSNGKPFRSSGGAMKYNFSLKREIPENWNEGTLDDLGRIVGGSTPSTEDSENFTNAGTPWITPHDLSNNIGNKFISCGAQDVSSQGIKSASLKILPAGSVLLSSRAPIGYMAIARCNLTTNQGFKSFIPSDKFSTAFIYYTVSNSLNTIVKYSSGSTFKEISGAVLKTIKVTLPDLLVVEKFTQIVHPLLKQQDLLEQENKLLEKLRDWLLPLLMNGQVTVK